MFYVNTSDSYLMIFHKFENYKQVDKNLVSSIFIRDESRYTLHNWHLYWICIRMYCHSYYYEYMCVFINKWEMMSSYYRSIQLKFLDMINWHETVSILWLAELKDHSNFWYTTNPTVGTLISLGSTLAYIYLRREETRYLTLLFVPPTDYGG